MQPTTVHTTMGPPQPPKRHPRPTESPLPNTQGWNGLQKAEQLNDASTEDKTQPQSTVN
ncbi:hypothetical protein SCLCIDRAFT_1216155 [Scleroderma citrinum Foug A]|uniref:Uncharacterized protein n=1 Tax=Scleroderma citrinum Foug A TaxID=1036808 RepID=A0A0C3DZF5_9AGAM|nr:hypothetical protein SCLCIDRAFT_1216155 [Scleroderma citrinum Foug A]